MVNNCPLISGSRGSGEVSPKPRAKSDETEEACALRVTERFDLRRQAKGCRVTKIDPALHGLSLNDLSRVLPGAVDG